MKPHAYSYKSSIHEKKEVRDRWKAWKVKCDLLIFP